MALLAFCSCYEAVNKQLSFCPIANISGLFQYIGPP